LKLNAKFETGSSYCSFKRYNQAQSSQVQAGVNRHPPPYRVGLHVAEVKRRKLQLEARLETGLSYFSFKRKKHTRFQHGF
jgi:hypothetical protein